MHNAHCLHGSVLAEYCDNFFCFCKNVGLVGFHVSLTIQKTPNDFACIFQGKYEEQFERSDEFQQQLIIKVREILTEKEWRRRKMQMRVTRFFCFFLLYDHVKNGVII
jgi:hypothetical protein